MKKNKILSLLLAGVMSLSIAQALTSTVSAKEITPEVKTETLENAKENANGTAYSKQMRSVEDAEKQLRMNPETIYDLDTIPARVELLVECGKAITFATTDLSDTIQKAHTEIGFAITKAVIKALNPLEGKDSLARAVDDLENLMEKLASYPKLTPDDVANIYYKGKLDKAIWNVRFDRDKNILGKKTFATYNELNRAITRAVGVQLNPSSKCKDIDKAVEDVKLAYEKALNGK